jgi:hypothetical protein
VAFAVGSSSLTQSIPNVAALGRRESDTLPAGIIAISPNLSPKPEQAPAKTPPEKAGTSDHRAETSSSSVEATDSASLNPDLIQLGEQFTGLTRVLDDLKSVGKGLPSTDVDTMMKPIFGVLKGIMGRIVAAPATTIADLGIKAQVAKWANRNWWQADGKLGLEVTTAKALIEQTIAAAALVVPRASEPPRAEYTTADQIDAEISRALMTVRPLSTQRG